ncbi:hypothetical protein [Rathayibacter sp. VKM Ac-2857]|uniref:hypothetical protein n=1 Tax=Rathayibacter sp. VKM Ac-2857 TaxID=2739020 RepID=UPI001565BB2E|nr:hypothetical protein [Rathayibacter sp. VKM Ac-2857]NQX16627.1 hypothetical protein [Rathayibacter sp. VKM Ac-2857]
MQSRTRHSLRTLLAAAATAGLALTAVGTTAAPAVAAEGEMTYTLYQEANPTPDQADAYARITAAMDAAVARFNAQTDITKVLNVYYEPSVPTADADGNGNGTIRFGADRRYQVEGTALHEISHTVGVGVTGAFYDKCSTGIWSGPQATALVKSWDGPEAELRCAGIHIYPYGLNFDNEFSELAFERHVEVTEAMIADGM